MQSRFTVKGTDNQGIDLVLAYELKEEEFKVDLYITPRKSLTAQQLEGLEKSWVEGKPFEFPADTTHINPNLDAESILPDNIRSEEAGKIRNNQNEWAYELLTAKLWESYLNELEELKKKSAELTQYDRQLFDDAKSFWERVLSHRKERDISQERLDKIKDEVNSVFEKLKTFKKTESAEFEAASAKLRDEFSAKLEDIKKRAEAKLNFKGLLEELKVLQTESRKNRYTKSDEQQLRKVFDSTFHHIMDLRNRYFNDKTESRLKGLNEVIEKMESSLSRDKRDLEQLARKANSNNIKSLELQLIKVKTNMLNETIASKEEKLKDILATRESVLKMAQKSHKHVEPKPKKEGNEERPTIAEDAPSQNEPKNPTGEEQQQDA